MHHVFETIPQYIDALDKLQKQAERPEMPIVDATLVIMDTKSMLETESYPKADDVWEDLSKKERKWLKWKEIYKKADQKDIIKRKARRDVEQFGGVEIGGVGRGEEPQTGRPTPVTLDELEGCFDSLASTVVTGKDMLDELAKSNVALTKTVSNLNDTNSCLMKKVEDLTNESKGKKNDVGGRGPELRNVKEVKYCYNCKRPAWHEPDYCFDLEKNKDNRPAWWKSVL